LEKLEEIVKNKKLIRIWGDIVSVSELVISIIIVAITTFIGYFLSFVIPLPAA